LADDFDQDLEYLRRKKHWQKVADSGKYGRTELKAPPKLSAWQRLMQGVEDMFSPEGTGANAGFKRGNEFARDEEVIRRRAQEQGLTPQQADKLVGRPRVADKLKDLALSGAELASTLVLPIDKPLDLRGKKAAAPKGSLREQQIQRIRDERELRGMRDEADPAWSKDRSFIQNLKHGGAKVVGEAIGDINPIDAVPLVGKTAKARVLGAGGLNAAQDGAIQSVEIDQGVRDEYDPYQTAGAATGGLILQSGGELVGKGAKHVGEFLDTRKARRAEYIMPVEGEITSGFGHRKAPKKGASSNHGGVDIAAKVGTPVRAPAEGTVTKVGRNNAKRGNWVEVEHADGTTSRYLHLSGFKVKPGDSVGKGQIFARTGATGNVTGPHLHWSMMKDGKPIDPMSHRFSSAPEAKGVRPIAPEELSRIMGDDARITPTEEPQSFWNDIENSDAQIDRRSYDDPINDPTTFSDRRAEPRETPERRSADILEFPTKREAADVLTARERQEMDASAPVTPMDSSHENTPVNDVTDVKEPITSVIKRTVKDIIDDESGSYRPREDGPLMKGVKKFFQKEDTPDAEVPSSVRKLVEELDKAKPLSREQKIKYSKERSERLGAVAGIGKTTKGEAGAKQRMSALKGELKKVEFEEVRSKFSQEDIDELFDMVQAHRQMSMFDKVSATNGLFKLLGAGGGKVPAPKELELLSQVFPAELVKALAKDRTFAQKFWGGVGNFLNMPRSIMSSLDLSAPLRQGAPLLYRKEYWKAFAKMFEVVGSEKAYRALMDDIESRPTSSLMKEARLAITDAKGPLAKREEAFMSDWAEKYIPVGGRLIRASNRAYSGFLNKLRADTFDTMIRQGKEMGIDYLHDEHALRSVARFINNSTGRGDLGKLNQAAPVLAGALFSPRLMASRLNMISNPFYYMRLAPQARKEAIKALMTYGAAVTGVLALAKAGGADVETDWRSSDFAKIKIGNTRYDIAGGFQQYLVLYSRLISNQTKTSGGEVKELGKGYKADTRKDVIENFARSKFSPVMSTVWDFFDGKNIVGEKFSWTQELRESFLPMITQDVQDTMEEHGITKGGAMTIPAVFGVGVTTYQPKMSKAEKKELGLEEEEELPDEDEEFLKELNEFKNL
jgi:murein DD-endopeptidase MepM/ murein hydrolase activator NlpD